MSNNNPQDRSGRAEDSSSPVGTTEPLSAQPTLFGHPTGLYTLFFAEMWERFSYYGMRALLVFYMIKGFLGYGDEQAYTVYGAYTALVYMTPFFGGMIADRLLGQRRAVVIGGVLMAAGHLAMAFESRVSFFMALALLIAGNGFFKPNISTIVGSLYPQGSGKRDGGFTIFYIGINLGAAMSPLLCGYVGETYGWHYGFGLATIGMLIGLAVFVMPTRVTQLMIGLGALTATISLLFFVPNNFWAITLNIFVAISLAAAGVIACIALQRGGLPDQSGRRPHGSNGERDWMVYLGTAIAIPVFALLVSGFSLFTQDGQPLQLFGEETIESISNNFGPLSGVASTFVREISKPAGLVLSVIGVLALVYLIRETAKLNLISRHRMVVAMVLIFFQMLFFAFFEQAGSSLNNFADRNVDRVGEEELVTEEMVGQTIRLQPTQEQLGYPYQGEVFTLTALNELRSDPSETAFEIDWTIEAEHVGMGIATRASELPASMFQSVNPVFILIFGLLFSAMWSFLGSRNMDPSSPLKFALGLTQLGLGFGALWLGAQAANDRGMVSVIWLLLGYLLQTTGELCLSPVGLSAMTKLAPKILVSTVMGSWFLATAFSQYLAGIISQFTQATQEGDGETLIPPPIETVDVYGEVFKTIAVAAILSGLVCGMLAPLLKRWMHEDVLDEE